MLNLKRDRLTQAFAELRTLGFVARQNHWCCASCAGYGVASNVSDAIDKGADPATIKGCVFYHNQDDDNKRDGRDFMLRYGPLGTEKHGDIGMPAAEAGKVVCEVLTRHGVKHEWNGDPSECITIKADRINNDWQGNFSATTEFGDEIAFKDETDKLTTGTYGGLEAFKDETDKLTTGTYGGLEEGKTTDRDDDDEEDDEDY